MSQDDKYDDFRPLLQGKDAWWHFLEAKSQGEIAPFDEGDKVEPKLELEDVGRMAQRHRHDKRPTFQIASTQSLRCDQCAAQIPADLTFCVYCGAAPRFMAAMRWQLLIVDKIEDPDVLEEVSCILEQGNQELSARELRHALSQPPAVFFFTGRDEHAAALVDRLYEIGIHARTSYADGPDVGMHREIVESIVRNPSALGAWACAVVAWMVTAFFMNPLLSVLGFIVTGALLTYIQTGRYQTRYKLDVVSVLNALTGFEPVLVQQAVHTLGKLQDESIRELLTVSLMEYYAIWRHLSAAPVEVRPLLSEVKENLDDLLVQILGSCTKYAELHAFVARHDVPKIQARLRQLKHDSGLDMAAVDTTARQIGELEKQLHTIHEAQSVLKPFAQRLHGMLSSFESLRARVAAMTIRREAPESQENLVNQIMLDLDTELGSFEDALDVVIEPSSYH